MMRVTGRLRRRRAAMIITFKKGEERVATLIDETNRIHPDSAVSPWGYELTTEVHNVSVMVGAASKTLQVNPCWLRFVVESGDFKACVEDEIVAWYLIEELTSGT
jgi:hypothetical protein